MPPPVTPRADERREDQGTRHLGREIAPKIIQESGTNLQHYDPEKGLKNIAVAEAAEQYFARAKDSTGLFEAIKAKLTEQRNFVLWWDSQEKNKGGRPSENL